jgi:hypothetical protein
MKLKDFREVIWENNAVFDKDYLVAKRVLFSDREVLLAYDLRNEDDLTIAYFPDTYTWLAVKKRSEGYNSQKERCSLGLALRV